MIVMGVTVSVSVGVGVGVYVGVSVSVDIHIGIGISIDIDISVASIEIRVTVQGCDLRAEILEAPPAKPEDSEWVSRPRRLNHEPLMRGFFTGTSGVA